MRNTHFSQKVDRIIQIIFGVILLVVAIAVSVTILSHLHTFARLTSAIVTISIIVIDAGVIAIFVAAMLGIRLQDDCIEEDDIDADKKS